MWKAKYGIGHFSYTFECGASWFAAFLQLEMIQLQSNNELKARNNNMPLLKFCKSYLREDEFPTLK